MTACLKNISGLPEADNADAGGGCGAPGFYREVMRMTDSEILRTALMQSALDSGCDYEDFLKTENKIVLSRADSRAKRTLELPNACDLVSYGSNIVASVTGETRETVEAFLAGKDPERAFEPEAITDLNRRLRPFGYELWLMGEYFLPRTALLKPAPCGKQTRILEKGEFEHLYLPQFRNALSSERKQLDILCAAAYDNGREIALAGCSMDAQEMWQIGVDVLPEYRRQGIASSLTTALACEVLKRGKIPFYGCSWANMKSQRNAIRSGFRPAWAQMSARRIRPEPDA